MIDLPAKLLDCANVKPPTSKLGANEVKALSSYCLFQDEWWLNLVTGGNWDEVSITNSDNVLARLPYVKRRRMGMDVLAQPKMTPYLGPWFRHSPAKEAYQFSERRRWTAELLYKLPRHDLFSQNLWPAIPDSLPFYWEGFSQTTYYTNWFSDLSNLEAIWSNFLDKSRWEIRKAEKKIKIVELNDVDRLCRLYKQTFEQQDMAPPQRLEFVRRVAEGSLQGGHARLTFAVDDNDNTHAGALLLYDARSTHYTIGGSDKKFRSSGGASLLLWDAIKFASRTSSLFDFEGSMVEGISHFFRGFNPRLVPFSHITRTSRRGAVGVACLDLFSSVVGRPTRRL